MYISEWERLPEFPKKIKVGEKFLSKKLLEQKETKVAGMWISYYKIIEVVNIEKKQYQYTAAYELLQEEVKV